MEKIREEFEAWARGDVNLDVSTFADGGYYRNIITVIAWDAWQSSRAELCVELPKSYCVDELGNVYSCDDVEEALDAAGVRYV